ncbi:MAG TPA: glycosyltransferase [Spirochaetales bacterium]|nr:glycosyltransferase [Spirochaetales bacterium]
MYKKRVLSVMLEVGFGHKSPALAVQEQLVQKYSDRVINDVVDFAHASGAHKTDEQLKKSWDIALAFPISARIGYLLVELAGNNLAYIDAFFKDFVEKGIAYIDKYKPDCIFATHPLCLYIAVQAKKELQLTCPIIAYVVDPFDGYAWWANEDADALLVASEYSKKRLIEHGINESKIIIKGFPLKQSFQKIDQEKADALKASLGLAMNYPTILTVAGAQGIGKVFQYIELLANSEKKINLITVAGKNKQTKKRMDVAASRASFPFISLGYVTNMHELISVADVILSKAGASTAMEAIFLQKPMIFTEWAAYNDRYIIDFVLDYNIGFYCPTYFSFLQTINDIVAKNKLEQCTKNLLELQMKPGAEEVADFIVSTII